MVHHYTASPCSRPTLAELHQIRRPLGAGYLGCQGRHVRYQLLATHRDQLEPEETAWPSHMGMDAFRLDRPW